MGAGGEQPDSHGRGSGAGEDRLQVTKQEAAATAGEQPAVFASKKPAFQQITLFPTVEEQIENIAQAQTEEHQTESRIPAHSHSGAPVAEVSEAVIGRALTSGSNDSRSIEHIVAFMQAGRSRRPS